MTNKAHANARDDHALYLMTFVGHEMKWTKLNRKYKKKIVSGCISPLSSAFSLPNMVLSLIPSYPKDSLQIYFFTVST